MYLYGEVSHNIASSLYSGQKKKVNGPEGSKYFFPVERGKFFLAPL